MAVVGSVNLGVEAALNLVGIVQDVILLEFGDSLQADHVLIDKVVIKQNI
ncbi:hypothetical protein LU293_03305 [Moraxella nasovis]|nr:hypothetical protein [Moraxella nasovis]UNU73939.1 hypothetical protein LU293_03305 [Moraxella nasovis]